MWSQVQQTTPDQTQLGCWLWSEVQEISHPIENQCSKSYSLIIDWSDLSLLDLYRPATYESPSYLFKFHQSFTRNHQQKLKWISGSDRGGCRSDVHSNRKTPATFPLKSSTLINFKLQILSNWEQLFWGRTSIFRPDGSKELCPIFDLSSQLRVGRKLQGHCFNWGVTQRSAILLNQSSPRKLTHCLGNADADILVVASSHSFLTVSFWNVLTSLGLTCSSEGFAGLIWNTESSWWEIWRFELYWVIF